jgi:Flp pilus assembly protein CpaB
MTVGIIALVAALAAAWGIRSYTAQEEAPPPKSIVAPPAPITKVLVAIADLPADRVIMMGDITQLPLNRQLKERLNGLDPDQIMANLRGIIGRRLKEPIKSGQPFLSTKFYLEGTGPSIMSKLRPGFRAMRVQVPDTREGGVETGMYVDVLFRAHPRRAQAGQPAIPEITKTLLQHIEVLKAERPTPRGAGAKSEPPLSVSKKSVLVTLAVPEEKADVFSVVEGRGALWLVPVPAQAQEPATGADVPLPRPLTLAALLGIKPPPPPVKPLEPPKPPPPFETAIYRRDNMRVNKFIDGKLLVGRARSSQMQPRSKPSVPEALPTPSEPRTEEKGD